MNWNNWGRSSKDRKTWQIDHIIPQSLFDFSDPKQVKKCWHYTNLQPLWAIDNMRKGNKIEFDHLLKEMSDDFLIEF